MEETSRYRLTGLSKLDIHSIQAGLPDEALVVETPEADEGRHNELATLAIVGGLALLGQAAAYYFGKSRNEELNLVVQEIRPDGSIRTVHLKLNRSSVDPVDNQIAKALKATAG